jgi:hypothetical protein
MALLHAKNVSSHIQSLTGGKDIAPNEVAIIDTTMAYEQRLIAEGILLVLDPGYVPPTTSFDVVESTGGSTFWRDPRMTFGHLPMVGNDVGDTRIVISERSIRTWNGSAWVQVGGGVGAAVGVATNIFSIEANAWPVRPDALVVFWIGGGADDDPTIFQSPHDMWFPESGV